MAFPTLDGVLLLLLVLFLPLHLLSLRFRVLSRPNDRPFQITRTIILLASVPVLLSAILAVSDPKTSPVKTSPVNYGAISQLEAMKLKISQLESILEENAEALDFKTLHVEENNKLIKEMEHKIQCLQNAIKASLSGSTHSEERVNALDETVRLLWEESRKNNFNIHLLESQAHDMEEMLEAVISDVEKMDNIVTEQWIQIRQLEQSLQMTKTMTLNVQKRSVHSKSQPTKCTMAKFIRSIRHCCLPELVGLPDSIFLGGSNTNSWISRIFDQFKIILLAFKKCHHEVQYVVKRAMEMNEITAALANREVVFLLASAIVTVPVISLWVACSVCLDQPE